MRNKQKFPLAATPDECRDPLLRHAEPSVKSQPLIVAEQGSPAKFEVRCVLKSRRQEKVMPPPSSHHPRHNAGAKAAVIFIGIPVVPTAQSRSEYFAARRAARAMLPH